MQPRTIGTIALQPTGNVQGGLYFYILSTGDIISRSIWTPLPMPEDIIDRVHELAAADKVSRGTIYSEGEDIFEPATHSTETEGVDVSFKTEGVDIEFENAENTGVDVSKNEIDNGVDVSKNEIDNGSDNAEVNENLDYPESLDNTKNDPDNLDANLDASENPDSLES